MKNLFFFIALSIAFFSVRATPQTITFSVDMRSAPKKTNSVIALRGNTSPLSWEKNNVVLTDADQDGFFTATVTFEKENTIEYKYVMDERYENGDNRAYDFSKPKSIADVWGIEIFATAPYFFKKDDKIMDFANRMKSEQIVHGVSQIILRNDKVDTLLTWGYRDIESQLKVDANTVFHIGGMGQSLTAFAVLRAAETKRLSLDAPLNQYLTSVKIEGDFTVRDLLLGKINLNGVTKPDGYEKGQKIPTLQEIFAGAKGTNTPKMKQKSSKSDNQFNIFAALLAQDMLENIYKMPFGEIIEKEILKPLEMKNTFVKAELSDAEAQNASVGYNKKGNAVAGKRLIFPELGFGGVWTSPSDYAKFVSHLIKASKGEDNRLISKQLAIEATKPGNDYRALVFPQGDSGNYLGGAATGFRTQTSFNAEKNTIMVTFLNSYENWRVMLDLEKAGRNFLSRK
jgi:hypothetical protein